MQFQSVHLVGGELVFAATNTVRLPFQFPQPIQGAYAILQRTRFEHAADRGSYYAPDVDSEWKVLEVSAQVLFDALQSNTGGQVQISFSFPGDDSPDLVHADVEVLVVGI